MGQGPHLLMPSGALSLWLWCLSHTHTQTTGQSAAGRIVGPALSVRLVTPLIGTVKCYQFGHWAEAAGGPGVCPSLLTAGAQEHLPGGGVWIVEPSLHKDASS